MSKKKIGYKSFVVYLACAMLVTLGIVLLFFSYYAVYKVYDMPMSVTVTENSGFNTDTDALKFGKAQAGNSNSRTIVLYHEYKKPLLIQFKKSGNISRFVNTPEEFYLAPKYEHEVTISAIIPKDTPDGYYDGNMKVYLRRI